MEWEPLAKDFQDCDGALCDIYVQDTTVDDWQAVMNGLKHSKFKIELQTDDQPIEWPQDVSELLFKHPDAFRSRMFVHIGSTTLNCHFFTHEEIEFDLNPRDMRPELLPYLIDFMKLLGRATNKPVILSVENWPEAVIMRLGSSDSDVEYVGPPYGS